MKPAYLSSRAFSLGILMLLAAFVLLTPIGATGGLRAEATFCLGFVMLFGYYVARILEAFKLPSITSYILVGVLCGPWGIPLLSSEVIDSLRSLDDVALSIIALIAGGEMKLATLKKRASSFAAVIAGQVLLSFAVAVAAVFLLRGALGAIPMRGALEVVAVGLLFGLATVARSPATTIGVVTETRAKGPLTDILVGVTVILDVVILLLAAIIIPAAETLVSGVGFSMEFARQLAIEVIGSIVAGAFFGLLIQAYIRWVRGYLPLFLLVIGLVGSAVCDHSHLSPLLSFMIAGFYVENFSSHGHRLIRGLERSAFPVYVLFFVVSGASIDMGALKATGLFALVLVLARMVAFYTGSFAAAQAVRELRPYRHTMWSGFLAQAGVTLGIAALVADRFPWGNAVQTIVLAMIAINQLVGPVALKLLLDRTGESGGMDRPPV